MSQYPEHEKLKAISDKSQACGEFLAWLSEQGFTLCEYVDRREEYHPARKGTNDLLARFFKIDQVKIENEKRAMLEECRAGD